MLPCAVPPPFLHGYIVPTAVRKLRATIEAANDVTYVQFIDGLIQDRKDAVSELKHQEGPYTLLWDVPYSLVAHERELLARLSHFARSAGHAMIALPEVQLSYETPPIFLSYPELENDGDRPWADDHDDEPQVPRDRDRTRPETISIEELLDVYQYRRERVVPYERGIQWESRRLRVEEYWLRSVVLIHELAHWMMHRLPGSNLASWPTESYGLGETEVHEGWAQLLTHWVAEAVGGDFKRVFEQLNAGQSSLYHAYKQLTQYPPHTVMRSLDIMRMWSSPARMPEWKSLLDNLR